MLTIAICDNDKSVAIELERIIKSLPLPKTDTKVFLSGRELLRHYTQESEYHIVLLDIEMPSVNGIETAVNLRKLNNDLIIIYITAYKEYVYQVFETLPFRFLEKPVEPSKLEKAIMDAVNYMAERRRYFFYKKSTTTCQIPAKEILYFEASNRKINIHAANRTDSFYGKFRLLTEHLDSDYFVQIHSSFIVNMDYISLFNEKAVVLNDNTVLPVSHKYKENSHLEHLKFIERRCGKW